MDRTVPSRENDEIALYIRTYYSLLRSTSEVEIRTLIEAHTRINSALHVGATRTEPDLAAFIYAILRLPSYCIADVRLVVMGQSEAVFGEKGFADVESWQPVSAPARRRRYFYDGDETVAVYIASRSDIDDLIPTLTAYQIEREKLHYILHRPRAMSFLREHCDDPIDSDLLQELSQLSNVAVDDLDRLHRIWGAKLVTNLLHIAERDMNISVRLLSGSLTDYRRATRRWWQNVARTASEARFEDRPVYFVSSNTHSLANLLSGFALQQEDKLVEFIQSEGSLLLQQEYEDILARNVPSSRENFLYYTLKKYEQRYP
ncbi:MAG: DUF6909 family protein, partial [Chloroflexota bacterium]